MRATAIIVAVVPDERPVAATQTGSSRICNAVCSAFPPSATVSWHSRRGSCYRPSGQGALPRDARAAGKARRCGSELLHHDEAVVVLRRRAAQLLGDSRKRTEIRARAEPEDRGTARPDERKAPLEGGRRLR